MQNKPPSSHRAGLPIGNNGRPSAHATRPAPSGSTELDPKLLWVTVRHCWVWATPIGLALAAAAAFAVFSTFVPVYKATHLLEVNQDYVVFKGVMPTPRNLVASERPLVLNALVLDEVKNDPEVQAFLESQPLAEELYSDIRHYLDTWLPRYKDSNRSYMTVGLGCTGGQHRSVYLADRLFRYYRGQYQNIHVRHRELQ